MVGRGDVLDDDHVDVLEEGEEHEGHDRDPRAGDQAADAGHGCPGRGVARGRQEAA
jgi:hypothetical protein